MKGDPTSWGPRVLLVEDNEENRRLLREVLSVSGVQVVGEAGDGQTGVELALALEPDVVLMDLRMPVVAGTGATRMIKQALPSTQVVILTSYDGELLQRTTQLSGAYAYLVKGCPPESIRNVIYQAWRYKIGMEHHRRLLKGDSPEMLG